ncbi:MAG: DUF1127 domain-containing protein [Zavarzinia sp.]|nr:DUF1127 domain-containing protein [Zavarzinia sp.]
MVNRAHSEVIPALPRAGFWTRLAGAFRRARAWREHRHAMAYLLTVDARLLRDIGIDRATVAGHYHDPILGLTPDRDRRDRG